MVAPRRYLPPIHLLLAFEAVARIGSITAAARELDLTQGAVSRQIQNLEAHLGAALFVREKRRLRLNEAGTGYAAEVGDALQTIARASLALRANPQGGTLNLAILPTFGARWLAPRLPDFLNENPGVTVNLSTRIVPFDFLSESLDAAIHFGDSNWPGTGHLQLFDEVVIPVCAPDFLRQNDLQNPADLQRVPLLHQETRRNAWHLWIVSCGIEAPPPTGMLFDQFATIAQAAVAGVGVALLPQFLIAGELADGRLVAAFDRPLQSVGSYYLIWPDDRQNYPPLKLFKAWLSQVVAQEKASAANPA
jgi:LysR family transcriptional regulator, glycine cleavage system transcriptional activator